VTGKLSAGGSAAVVRRGFDPRGDLRTFGVADDSLAPDLYAGNVLYCSVSAAWAPGDLVVAPDHAGRWVVRRAVEGDAGVLAVADIGFKPGTPRPAA
jgi:hypothetical protein